MPFLFTSLLSKRDLPFLNSYWTSLEVGIGVFLWSAQTIVIKVVSFFLLSVTKAQCDQLVVLLCIVGRTNIRAALN
jgi:hypothetical protein